MKHPVRRRRLRNIVGAVALVTLAVLAVVVPIDTGRTRIVTSAEIARSPADVFAYVTTPANWPRWHPSSIAVGGDAGHPFEVGETVVEEFDVAGRHGSVTWRVVERDPDRAWRIAGTIDGRDAGTVGYLLEPSAGGTRFVREFEYRTPGLLFAALNRLSLRDRIDAESRQALRQLKACLESSAPAACDTPAHAAAH